jgi:hypothetical protein
MPIRRVAIHLALALALAGAAVALAATPGDAPSPQARIEIRVLDPDEGTIFIASAQAGAAASMRLRAPYEKGARAIVRGGPHMAIRLDESTPECLVFCPGGTFQFAFPFGDDARAYPKLDRLPHVLTARVATAEELDKYRNLALNPYDQADAKGSFPHATTNSVCRGESVFAARNAIDGLADNDGHGDWPHQSWGPDQKDGLWWRVDFGREVEVDRIVLALRADLPHDKFWRGADLVFPDGTKKALPFEPTGRKQEFPFPAKKVTWVELRDFVQPEPRGWCALSEVEVWGRDLPSSGAGAAPAK